MRVIVNGLGCTYTGSRLILEQVLTSTPADVKVLAIVPIVEHSDTFNCQKNIKLMKLKHSIWGMYLRPLLELYVNLLMWLGRYDRVINLSNYGLCFSKNQVLYIHNPLILDTASPERFGQGNANKLTRWALNTFLRKAECIFVQTDHMNRQLQSYCLANSISLPRCVNVLKPFPLLRETEEIRLPKKNFPFQFFYPSSHFLHKRTDLAINAISKVRSINREIGLVLTMKKTFPYDGVDFLGSISVSEVYSFFKVCDALLFTSERETLGLPLLEAMFFGKPAVLPDKEYAKEIYGDAAVYYQGDDPGNIKQAILELYENYDSYIKRVQLRKESEWKSRLTWDQHWQFFLMR